ncbi:pimeloyl-ACP methyl ester carboxylesterase/DNA-binding CsgD family transcriptional regulator [Mycolicibacterium sp. BK556]|uniref:alpha/beta fold hydrolase n=1 Tax=Mycobacteriaceae TaxID=1762 RepID=UPI00105D5630|nr:MULTISPECIES: alpha/beta fold hydrolase [Mycobacteriaceae]MBB3603831.1 pimeloyl-ACP methyl ester carboxylesterase/DNA-binding CsgD family transcriptional regulator [Mycolicibacterium sp. BK556]MBB3634026.1 pimeloyl-ACP methyl ester carboxylesterase/DNA-binding CsgD family transcriptional regulator [Mycolicibacterium sp. BK607]MBB3751607.1 pimeloyl-ACP methyl ester carboxylesterase/DNA-binding CsgD family transcriptional regulator [Mycolicibacterium sp. BK634]TDO12121.1 alpha/beta hydrolase f
MYDTFEIRFLPVGARRLAYEVRGDGPPLVAPAWWVSHLELDWQNPDVRRFWEGVADNYTLIRYDRLGVGMSDRTVDEADLTLDTEVAILHALLDEIGLDRVSLIGGSSGSCTAVAFAATYPERVERVVLYGSYPVGDVLTAPGVGDAIVAAVRAHWGLGARMLSDIFLGSAETAAHERFSRLQRESATAETAAALLEMVYRLDIRAQLPLVAAPTTVVHRRDDRAVPYRLGREVAAAIPGASFIPLHGQSHFPWHGDVDSVVRACRQGLAPDQPPTAAVDQSEPVLLSQREREILACVAHGLGDREIAEQLQLSPHTVHRHVANIRRKLGATSRTAAVAQAARLGLV